MTDFNHFTQPDLSTKLFVSFMSIYIVNVHENLSHFASLPHSLSQGTRSNQNTKKAQEPPGDIWRMPNMADKWRHSCARLRAPSLSGTWSYEAAHTRLCLLSLWHGKTTNRRDGKRERERRKGKKKGGEGWDEIGWEKDWWQSRKIKVSTKTDPIKKE